MEVEAIGQHVRGDKVVVLVRLGAGIAHAAHGRLVIGNQVGHHVGRARVVDGAAARGKCRRLGEFGWGEVTQCTYPLGNHVSRLKERVVVLFRQFVQRLEQWADHIPMVDVALDHQLVGIGKDVGQCRCHLLTVGPGQADVEFFVLDLRFKHGGCLLHSPAPVLS
ncbi:hypothetical protein D9M72_446670 [compost metagenome]